MHQGSPRIVQSSTLTHEVLTSLFSGSTLFFSADNYIAYENLDVICDKIYQAKKSSYTYLANLVSHIGDSSYLIDDDKDKFENYYDSVEKNTKKLDDLFAPQVNPIRMLQRDLDKLWPPGATIAMLHERPMFSGIIRVIHKGSMIHAHQDLVSWSNPKSPIAHNIIMQFGMNYFLRVPKKGGRLFMWEREMSRGEFDIASGGDFCIQIDKLPERDIDFKPNRGMLTLLNSRCLHAIERSLDDNRIAVSCFIGYQGKGKPLLIWS